MGKIGKQGYLIILVLILLCIDGPVHIYLLKAYANL